MAGKPPSRMLRRIQIAGLGFCIFWIVFSDWLLLVQQDEARLDLVLNVLGNTVCVAFVILFLLLAYRYHRSLRESEAKFRIVADNTYAWEFWVDADGRYVYISPSCKRVTGHEAEEFLSNPELVETITHPEDRERYRQHRDEVAAKQAPAEMGFRILRPDGAVRWIHHVCQPVFDETGRFMGVRGSNRDVTDRKRGEEALRESEERYRKLVDLCPDAILVHSGEAILYANAAAANMMGASHPDELVGKPVLLFVHPDSREIVKQRIRQVLVEGKRADLKETKFLRLDGKDMIGQATGMPVTFAGKPAVQVVLRDVTARKQTEEALRESEQRYRGLVELCPDAILVHCDGTIVYANSAAARLLGASSPGDLVGRGVLSVTHPDSPGGLLRRVPRAEEQGRPLQTKEHKLVRKDGTPVTVEVAGMEISHQGRPSVLLVMRDVSDRKRAEQERARLLAQVRQERDKLMTLIDSMTDEVWFCDADGKISLVNAAGAEGLGVEDRDSLLRALPELIARLEPYNPDGSRRTAGEAPLLRSLKGEIIKDEEEMVRHVGTGEVRHRRVSSAPLRNLDGQIIGAVAVVRDVTDRKRAEEALRQSQKQPPGGPGTP